MVFPNPGFFCRGFRSFFLFKLCLGIHGGINICYNIYHKKRSSYSVNIIYSSCRLFTRTEITCIQVALPPYLKLSIFYCLVYPRAPQKVSIVQMCVCVGGGGGVHGSHM